MKKKSTSKSAFFNLRVLIASMLCLFGVFVALVASGAFSNLFAQTKGTKQAGGAAPQDGPGTQRPDVVQMVGPVRLDQDLRSLPYIPQKPREEERRLTRYVPLNTGQTSAPSGYGISGLKYVQALLKNLWRPAPTMPGPLFTFEGIGDTCGCQPSDNNGDVGPNHYIESINESFKIFDKSGNTLAGPTTYNSFFAQLTGTPCQNENFGDPFTIYDAQADRWVMSDFAFPGFPSSGPFYECIGVSVNGDPVSGGWNLYALEVSASNLDDYPKAAVWNNPQPGGAYFFTFNLFNGLSQAFEGVAAFALDRGSMLTGGPTNAIGFTVGLTGVGASYSFLPATFRTGDPPPAGRDEFVLAIDTPASGVTLTQVHGRLFHADFVNPANSTFGVGPDHLPNAEITVNGFIDAAIGPNFDTDIVPQMGSSILLDTVGDRLFTPVVYQNLSGTESLWATHDNLLNFPNGPVAVRWYQFDVTGGNFPATAAQQQDWTNGNDGLWRWMPSIAVDQNGNTAIGYSTSDTTIFPSIRYAGRLVNDPPGNLAQGEAIMFAGVSRFNGNRWGDYTRTEVDPSDGMSFWHINQYAQSGTWHTRIDKFRFGPAAQSAFSRKVHGGAGTFDVPLPLGLGNVGVDGGSGGDTNE